jgi:transmembrane 9 superfamily member 1
MHLRIIVAFFFVSYNSHGSAQSLPGNVEYKKGDPVPLYANKVGPFANPSEQYEFYTLPFCAPKEEERKGLHLGEVLGGDRMMKSLYSLPFLVKFTARTLCSYTLQPKEIEMFQRAIDEDYFFELIYDGIPVRGFIGEKKKEIVHGETTAAYHLFTHYIFSISHNGEKILGVRWEHDPFDYLDITDKDKEVDVHFKYSSKWLKPSPGTTHLLGDTPADQEHLQIRWFSILNSIGTVLLLTGFLAVILMRVLRNDISRYALMEQGGDSAMTEESGWKLVHGDVFRPPQHPELLCAVLGNGAQLLCIVLGVLLLALLGVYSHYNRGALLVAALVRAPPAAARAGAAGERLARAGAAGERLARAGAAGERRGGRLRASMLTAELGSRRSVGHGGAGVAAELV